MEEYPARAERKRNEKKAEWDTRRAGGRRGAAEIGPQLPLAQ
jgi:hypothetical protein